MVPGTAVAGSDTRPAASHISQGGGAPVWHLCTPRSSLVIGLGPEGAVRQHYWGERLSDAAVVDVIGDERHRWDSSFDRPAEIEEHLPVDGGHRWGIPGLQVRFPGGVRSLELGYESQEIVASGDSVRLTLTLLDPGFGLGVHLHYVVRDGTDVIERWVELDNPSTAGPVQVLRADSGNWVLPDLDEFRISSTHGHWSAETQLERRILPRGEYTLTSRHGTTGHQSNPWMMIDDGTAGEESGDTYTVALAWSGSWRMTAQRRADGGVSVSGGFGQEGLVWDLGPGERLVTPSALGRFGTGGFGAASRAWHDYVRSRVLSHPDEVRPVLFDSWEATSFDISEEKEIALAHRAAALGAELFLVDDGWFAGRTDDRAGLGDWWPDPERFPNGLSRLAEEVRSLGMGFGLWVEPEMVNPDSDLYREHPDWVQHWPGRRRDERRNQLILNFARGDVRAWADAWLDALVRDYRLDFLKWDMNRPFTQAGWPGGETAGDLLYVEHTRGVYAVIDRLRAAHPQLRIEACASGGGRVDLGILSRVDQFWPSDNTDALDRQVIQHGFSQLYPVMTMESWVTDETNPMTGRRIPIDYRCHVAMAGVMGVGGNLCLWSEDETARAAEHIASYKQIRGTIQHGDLYRHGAAPGRTWSALEYVDEDTVVVLAYEPHRSLATTPRRLRLRGPDPRARYRDVDTGRIHHGSTLRGHGIRFNDRATLRGWNNTRFSGSDYASSLTVLRRLPRAVRQ